MTNTQALEGALAYAARPKQLLIGGKWRDGEAVTQTENPVTGGTLATLAEAGRRDVDAAVDSARQALNDPAWAAIRPRERAQLLFSLADAIEARTDEFAALEAIDSGKPLRNARNVDIPQAVDHLRYYAGWVTKIEGATITSNVGDYMIYTRREPVGVCGLIVPWNYPLLQAMWKLAPALACGNTVILKPAEQTSLTALRLGELACEVGFPPGVFNVLTGRGEVTGAALAAHPGVDKISFTGSTEVGKSIAAVGAANLTRVSLELGGKSPNIVFADADLEAAASGAAWGIFYNMGEDCCAGSRLFIQEQVYDEFLAKVTEVAKAIKVGDPFADGSKLGPLVSGGPTPGWPGTSTALSPTARGWSPGAAGPITCPAPRATTSSRRSWPMSPATRGSSARRSSGRLWWPRRSPTRSTPSGSPTTRSTASRRACGRRTWAGRTGSRMP